MSTPFNAAFRPMSPTVTPGYGTPVTGSRILVKKACNPLSVPSGKINLAHMMAWVAVFPTRKNRITILLVDADERPQRL